MLGDLWALFLSTVVLFVVVVVQGWRIRSLSAEVDDRMDAVYEDRNLLSVMYAIDTDYPSGWYPAPDTEHGGERWAIVWIDSDEGELSWHVPRELVEGSALEQRRREGAFGGYDRQEKNERIERLIDRRAPRSR